MRYKADSDPFYHSAKWKHMRDMCLRRDGYMDQLDLRNGEHNQADLVHHIFPREVYPEYRFCLWNLISLTSENHERMHNRITGELSAAGRALMAEVAKEQGIKISTLVLVCGLPGSGKTEYVRSVLGNGVVYDLDWIAAAFRLRMAHDERHEVARRMANSMGRGFAEAARRYGGKIHVIRTAPELNEALAYEPDEIVICKRSYDITKRKDYRRIGVSEMQQRLDDLECFAIANDIPLHVV